MCRPETTPNVQARYRLKDYNVFWPQNWQWVSFNGDWSLITEDSSYFQHLFRSWNLALQLFLGHCCGTFHVFYPSLLPFVAERVVAEVGLQVVDPYKKNGMWPRQLPPSRGIKNPLPIAYRPDDWVYFVKYWEHVKPCKSYIRHFYFAFWAQTMVMFSLLAFFINGLFPFLLPEVGGDVIHGLAVIIIVRRDARKRGVTLPTTLLECKAYNPDQKIF